MATVYNLKWSLTVGIILFSFNLTFGQAPITPPPLGPKPVVSNGVVYNLFHLHMVPEICRRPYVLEKVNFEFGVVIKKEEKRAIMKSGSPYKMRGNIELEPNSCLWIEPGTIFHFSSGYGFIVNGTLIARGSEEDGGRIVMTRDPDKIDPSEAPFPDDARLVDGNTTMDGQLQLMYRGRWRGVCTNFVNYTKIDANVTCRHLGFVWGNFTYHSFSRNKTDYMLFERPDCSGSEKSLFDCPGKLNIRVGANICDGQQVIGFQCEGLRPDLARTHWRGLEFYNATVQFVKDQNLNRTETYSWLEYLDVWYAGRDTYRGGDMVHGRASVSASPHVPLMNNVSIMYGAYDGLNLTELRGRVHIANSTVSFNRGYGAFIKTAVGQVLINMTNMDNNWGDGVKMYMTNYTIHSFQKDYPNTYSFCRSNALAFPRFPITIYENIIDERGQKPQFDSYDCQKSYSTVDKDRLSLHFFLMERDEKASGTITVYDGTSTISPVLGVFPVSNGSFPQSVTTSGRSITIRFQYNLPPEPSIPGQHRCKNFRACLRFLLDLVSYDGLDEELRFINSSASNNTGYGVNVQDMRCKVSLNSSVVSDNNYGAGVRVYQGAGEISINNSRVERNERSGVNITYAGGYQLVNNSYICENHGYGVITEYDRLNNTRIQHSQKMEVVKAKFFFNEWIAFRVGNYCKEAMILVNESHFKYNYDEAIEFLSCNFTKSPQKNVNFSLAYNEFDGNKRHGILMSPLINTIGIITNNTFMNHSLGALRIDNGYDLLVSKWYAKFAVNYRIFENTFKENQGRYCVSLRLTQNAPNQHMEFKFNKVIGNAINDTSPYLNPRSHANAPIIVSSSNIVVQRNHIYNPDSVRDIATHLVDPSVIINGSLNWWETINHSIIYNRLFDRDDRYNLAQITYYPVLKDGWLYGDKTTITETEYRWPFRRGNKIGGILDVEGFTTDPNTKLYYVDRDIFIVPNAVLKINPGTTLLFENSIGMVIHGRMIADGGSANTPILFTLNEPVNETEISNRTDAVRLADGRDEYEGRLEVNINGRWGAVCKNGWIQENAMVVCQQLGLTYHPDFGLVHQQVRSSSIIELSSVACTNLDTDIRECHSIKRGDFDCQFDNVVYLRCQKPTWSGITIPAIPTYGQIYDTQIKHVIIQKAGQLDYQAMTFTPALRIDYNFYKITALQVTDSVSDGVNIKYANPFTENLFEKCHFVRNLGNGFLTRSPFLKITESTMNDNQKGGFVYDPFFTEYEALSVRNFLHQSRMVYFGTRDFQLGDNSMAFIISQPGVQAENRTYTMQLSVSSSNYRITLQILDYNPLTNVEKVTIYNSNRNGISPTTVKWEIEEDLVDFPITSKGDNYLTIQVVVRGVRSGRLAFAAHSRQYSTAPINSLIEVHYATVNNNYQGIVTKHYNNPSNEKLEIFHRVAEEEIRFTKVDIKENQMEAMYIPSLTKYHEHLIPTQEEMTRPERLGQITYVLDQCTVQNNGKAIIADHNHVDFSNNVWKWKIQASSVRDNKYGGLEVELPRVNDIREKNKWHSVQVNQSTFENNKNFAFTVNGYYADVEVSYCRFTNNACRRGLVLLAGMEKDLVIYNNEMINNQGKYAMQIDMQSHAEYNKPKAFCHYNNIKGNRPGPNWSLNVDNTPSSYAVSVYGVQNITLNRNLIHNPDYQYELIAGVTSLSLENKMNVKENWWGTAIQAQIIERIFDFDDWNNYAIADYFPQLTADNVNSLPSTGTQIESGFNFPSLKGRITKNMALAGSSTYYVIADVTVMPNAKLTIEPGTRLQFYPNVGILVLGQLVARGLPYSRISFRPVVPGPNIPKPLPEIITQNFYSNTMRLKRDSEGEIPANEGFLELYNSSSNSWNLMCDNQFNRKTAEVVCRGLGMETLNVDVRFTHLYDHFIYKKPMYFVKEFWTYSYYCVGDENSLDECQRRINYKIQDCIQGANYTYIRCGKRNLDSKLSYWGNIRIASPTYQEDTTRYVQDQDRSVLENIDIYGAGMLHGERVGAIQATYRSPKINNINITNCLWNGLDIIAPRYEMKIKTMNIDHNLGYGINFLILNGESRNADQSSFRPLLQNTVPYFLSGLVDICKMEKELTVKNRLIIYYKYSQQSVDCVKVIRSENRLRKVSLRLLQFNLYYDEFYRNLLEIYDGNTVTEENRIGVLDAQSKADATGTRYLSNSDTIGVHIHASNAYEDYGFIAEITTSPLSDLAYPDSTVEHRFEQMMVTNNEDGAILYQNVGEVCPSLYIDSCMIENNGLGILNLTSQPVINIGIQNTKIFNFQHNFVNRNKGGLYCQAFTTSTQNLLRGNITNNVFSFGSHGETLNISGHHFQKMHVYENYIFNNSAGDYRDNVHVQTVGMNFTFNVVVNNTGHHIVRTFSEVDTSATQQYLGNYIYQNNATALYRAVMAVGSGKPEFKNNYLVNEESAFELLTNEKREVIQGIEIRETLVDATYNWWGSERRGYINGKIWDGRDNSSLVEVNFEPYRVSNSSLVNGKCPPGWTLNADRCYRYMGAALPYAQAGQFCRDNLGFLAEADGQAPFLRYLLRLTENVYSKDLRVWVFSEVAPGYCSAFQDDYIVAEQDCQRILLPFICEKDPYINPPGSDVLAIAIGVSAGVFGTALIVIIILAILWKVKSKGRKQQKFERQASIRSSLRSSVRSRSNMTVLSTGTNKRRFDDKYSVSSSKGHLIDDDVSLSNISLESRSRGRERMDRSFERLDAPRLGSRDRLDQVNSSNGSLGMILSNGHTGSQHRLINGKGSFDRLKEDSPRNSPRNSPRSQRPIRATLGRNTQDNSRSLENRQHEVKPVQPPQPPKKAILPPVKPPQVRPPNPPVVPEETDGGYTDDGFSEHEFDDFTTTADEAEYSPNNNPNRVENQIEALRRLPNISEKPAYGSESSVDMDHRSKHPSNFFLPDTPPTPPPPLPLDSYPMKTMVNSPVLSDASSRRPTPQPRGRPVAPPRSSIGSSKESLNRSVNPLHLSQGDLNLIDKKPSWLNDQVRETSASESDSDSESANDSFYDAGHKNKAFLENENLPQTVRAPGYTPPQNQSDRTDYSSPWRDVRYPSTNQSNSNLSRGSREMSNMDYLQGPYSNLGYEGSQENIPSYDEALNAPTNAPYSPDYTNSSLPPPYSPPSSQPFSPVAQNVHFLPGGTNTQHPVYRIGSVNSIPMSGSDGLPRDIAFMDYRMGSQSTLPNPDGSMPDLSTGESHADLAEPDLDDMNDTQYQGDIDPFPQSPRGVPSYQQSPAQEFQEPRRTRSREQLDRASPFTQRSRDSPVLYLDDQRWNQRRPEPIETEI